MSIRFAIKNTAGKAEKEGDTFLRFSGTGEPFRRTCERAAKKIGVDGGGNPKLTFTTGLEEKQIQFYSWYGEDEKKALIETITNLRPLIEDFYGGKDVTDPSNQYFWKEDRNVNRLSLSNEDIDVFFDTEKPAHALLYLSIISGAFMELVAPTREWAEKHQIPHYMVLEIENAPIDLDEEEDIRRSDAHAALYELRKEHGRDALFIAAWVVLYDTNAFGAVHANTSEKDLVNYIIKFIDGKLVNKRKRNTPKVFLEYVEKWKGQQTRPLLYTEAYVKAGEYFNYINQKEKKYVTMEGTILGNTVAEAVASLMKPKFNSDFEKLRDQVENKWKE